MTSALVIAAVARAVMELFTHMKGRIKQFIMDKDVQIAKSQNKVDQREKRNVKFLYRCVNLKQYLRAKFCDCQR